MKFKSPLDQVYTRIFVNSSCLSFIRCARKCKSYYNCRPLMTRSAELYSWEFDYTCTSSAKIRTTQIRQHWCCSILGSLGLITYQQRRWWESQKKPIWSGEIDLPSCMCKYRNWINFQILWILFAFRKMKSTGREVLLLFTSILSFGELWTNLKVVRWVQFHILLINAHQ